MGKPEKEKNTVVPETNAIDRATAMTEPDLDNTETDECLTTCNMVNKGAEEQNTRERHRTGDSDIEEVEQERVPTPDIIDLLDSDPEEESTKEQEGNLMEESIYPTENSNLVEETPEVTTYDNIQIPMAPKLIGRREGENDPELFEPP